MAIAPSISQPAVSDQRLSFVINEASDLRRDSRGDGVHRGFERQLDRVNSADLIQQARRIFWTYLATAAPGTPLPHGVVLQGRGGRVVFSWPALLPNEHFVPGHWLHPGQRTRSKRQSPCPPQQP
jgi:hypothetical protein